MKELNKGRIGLLIMAMIWGSSFAFNELAMQSFTPYQLLALRYSIAALCLLVIFRTKILSAPFLVIKKGVLLGIVLYLAYIFQTVGLFYTSPTKNAFLTAFNVILVPFLAATVMKRKIKSYDYLGAIVTLVGIGVMSMTSRLAAFNLGDLLTLISAFFFAWQILFSDMFAKQEDPLVINSIQMITAAFLANVVALIEGQTFDFSNHQSNMTVIYLAVFCTMIAFLLQTYSQQFTSETEAVLIMSLESIFGMFFSILIVKDYPTIRTLIGAMLIIGGVLIVELVPLARKNKVFIKESKGGK
ncbi:DMT family transporter [Facklamia sp. DSM 111018]|uniref:DMT family transporter n=1 Tax=Facklamia lactis TaxID=2749967 RepID=A0ABS0LPJ6_9LACT|nr:DMT family transporter [Facklamia lactis]MBG9980130.1 DMT family transporter [Facklamia lactis]MBG9985932.1 DMT family transporter [Facklamia lactis]